VAAVLIGTVGDDYEDMSAIPGIAQSLERFHYGIIEAGAPTCRCGADVLPDAIPVCRERNVSMKMSHLYFEFSVDSISFARSI
jgi:hypothetical protein